MRPCICPSVVFFRAIQGASSSFERGLESRHDVSLPFSILQFSGSSSSDSGISSPSAGAARRPSDAPTSPDTSLAGAAITASADAPITSSADAVSAISSADAATLAADAATLSADADAEGESSSALAMLGISASEVEEVKEFASKTGKYVSKGFSSFLTSVSQVGVDGCHVAPIMYVLTKSLFIVI